MAQKKKKRVLSEQDLEKTRKEGFKQAEKAIDESIPNPEEQGVDWSDNLTKDDYRSGENSLLKAVTSTLNQTDAEHGNYEGMSSDDKFVAPTLGKFTMNGRTISGQTALDRLYNAYSSSDFGMRGMYDVAAKAIKDGNEARYNPENNTIEVYDSNGNNVTSQYAQGISASPNDSNFRKTMQATFHTANDRFKRSGEYMKYVDMNEEPVEYKGPRLKWDRGFGWFDPYKEGEEDSASNKAKWGIVQNNFNNIYGSSNIDDIMNAPGFDMSAWKGHESDLKRLRTYLSNVGLTPENRETFFNDLQDRVRKGTATQNDLDFLKLIGFSKDTPASSGNGTSGDSDDSNNYEWGGNKDSWAGSNGATITKNDDGTFSVNGGIFGDYKNWYLGRLAPFKGTKYENGFLVNGILRTRDEIIAHPDLYAQYIGSFISNKNSPDWAAWYDAANASKVRFMGDRIWNGFAADDKSNYGEYTSYNSDTQYSPELYDFYRTNNIKGAGHVDATGFFEGVPEGQKVYAYLDPTKRNYAGVYVPQYVYFDADGTAHKFDSREALANATGWKVAGYATSGQALNPSAWQWRGDQELGVKRTFRNNGQDVTIASDREGNTWIYWGDNHAPVKVAPENMELLKRYMNGEKATTSQLEALSKVKSRGISYQETENPHISNVHTKLGKRANGGKIDWNKLSKLQYGGIVLAPTTRTKTFETDAKKDVIKDHKLNGSDGGLSTAEKQQLMAAGLDLAGVGASMFGPIGNIVGGLSGIGGSILRYKADKAQGNQGESGVSGAGKDLAIGLALDVASMIPLAGVFAKAGKSAKAIAGIRKVAKPLLTLATVAGMTSMINPLKKVISGEDLTSQDLVDLGRGLSSGILFGAGAAKSIRKGIGQRNLIKDTLADVDEVKHTAKVGDKELKKTASEIQEMVESANGSKKELIAQVKSEAKDLGIELSDGDAKKALDSFGIKFNKSEKSGHWYNRNRKVTDRIGEATFESSNPEARSTIGYAVRDMFGGFGNQNIDKFIAQNISASDLNRAAKDFNTSILKHNSSRDIYLRDLAYKYPHLFKPDTFEKGSWDWRAWRNMAGSRSVPQSKVQPSVPQSKVQPSVPQSKVPHLAAQSRFRLQRLVSRSNVPRLVPQSRVRLASQQTPKQVGSLQDGGIMLRKGGKIYKFSGGSFGQALKANIPNLMDLGSMISNVAAVNSVYKDKQKANNALYSVKFDTPRLEGQRFSTASIDNSTRLAENPYRDIQFNSSDVNSNMAGELQRADKISNIEQQKGDNITRYVDSWNAQDVERINKQRSLDTQAANQKSQYFANVRSRGAELDASQKQEQWVNNVNPYMYQVRQNYRDAWNKKNDLAQTYEINDLQSKYNDELDKLLHTQFDSAYEADTTENKAEFDNWILSDANRTAYTNFMNSPIVKQLQNKYKKSIYDTNQRYVTRPAQTFSFKQGGKTSIKADPLAQMAIQGDREAKRAVQIATQHLNRMLEKLMK